MRTVLWLAALLILSACGQQGQSAETAPAQQEIIKAEPVRVLLSTKDEFENIMDNIKDAIADRGIKINNISHIGHMLTRTAADVGGTKVVYKDAEAVEFCSSTVSRATMEADPHNISYCPYIIAVYVITEQPDTVYVSFRKPPLVGNQASRDALKIVGDLLQGIVNDALEQ
ncbi:MAG TPA: DUF302 domain-containing protein [Gammaproteobacteria bacterium]|nr:DUF302 domain-containing protein [Gammaproteobacteria bacterium]